MWEDHRPGIEVVPLIFYSANFYAERSVDIINNHSRLAGHACAHGNGHGQATADVEGGPAPPPTPTTACGGGSGGGGGGGGVVAAPLFLYLPIQNVHAPYQLPPSWEEGTYPAMWDQTYANMLYVRKTQRAPPLYFAEVAQVRLLLSRGPECGLQHEKKASQKRRKPLGPSHRHEKPV